MSDEYVFVVLHIQPRGYWDYRQILAVCKTKGLAVKCRAQYAYEHGLIDENDYRDALRYTRVNYFLLNADCDGYIRIEKHPLTSDEKCG